MVIPDISELQDAYRGIDDAYTRLTKGPFAPEDAKELLIAFPRGEAPSSLVTIEFHELTAICPWTAMPDQGSIHVQYEPTRVLLELKSFKYYLLAFRDMHITQEHLAQLIYADLLESLDPASLYVKLDYMPRGGLHTVYELPSPNE